MSNHLEQTWVAYAFRAPEPADRLAARRARARNLAQSLFREELRENARFGPTLGHALWHRGDPRLRSPLWVEDEDLSAAATSAPMGSAVLGDSHPPLASAATLLRRDPERAIELNPPFLVSILSDDDSALTIANDVLGTARLFAIDVEGGTVWSNRIGALLAFAGHEAQVDERAWQVLGATGWFLGETTAIAGVRQHRSATIIRARSGASGTEVAADRNLAGLAQLVRPRRARRRASARDAAGAARALATDVGAAWSVPVRVDLSGGRDSRVTAAAAIAAGIQCELVTSDLEHGEVALVEDLLARLPAPPRHRVIAPEREPEDSLLARAAALHAVHDGMRNPQSLLRAPMALPHAEPAPPSMSGHGGEIGHGFYYSDARQIRDLRRGGRKALLTRLERAARKKHNAAREEAYYVYLDEAGATLDEGEALGLSGPALLDYYYLAQRLANRSGLATRNDRWSACSTPAFIRAAFDLSPRRRLGSAVNAQVAAELVPEWRGIPYYEPDASRPETKRPRLWEKPGHREEVGEIIAGDTSWHGLFDPATVKDAWQRALAGDVHHHFEPVFTRVVWRASYERHLALLRAAASHA